MIGTNDDHRRLDLFDFLVFSRLTFASVPKGLYRALSPIGSFGHLAIFAAGTTSVCTWSMQLTTEIRPVGIAKKKVL